MTDAMKPARQNVQQQASDELVGGERHDARPLAAVAPVVLVAEGDAGFVAISAGSVKTTWKYPTGSRSASRSASQVRAAAPWHFGQCRLRQLL